MKKVEIINEGTPIEKYVIPGPFLELKKELKQRSKEMESTKKEKKTKKPKDVNFVSKDFSTDVALISDMSAGLFIIHDTIKDSNCNYKVTVYKNQFRLVFEKCNISEILSEANKQKELEDLGWSLDKSKALISFNLGLANTTEDTDTDK